MTKPKPKPAGDGAWSIDDFLSDFQAPAAVVHLTARGDLLARHSDLKVRWEAARDLETGGIDDFGASELETELRQVEQELRGSLRKFTIRAVGDQAWSDLIAAHPPTDKDKADNRFAWCHPDTFWPAAYTLSIVDPAVSVAAAEKMVAQIDAGQMSKLRNAILEVNGGGADIPKSVASSASRRDSKPNSPTL